MQGTIRTVSAGTREAVRHRAGGGGGIAAAHDMVAEVELHAGYPVTVNHAEPAAEVLDLAAGLAGTDHMSRWRRR